MGDRGNIVIVDPSGAEKLFMYTHWTGSDVHRILAKGLKKGESRWGDDSYLNRIIFQTLIEGDDGTTGYGISTTMGDGGCEVYVCHEKETVRFRGETLSFKEFIEKWS